MPSFHKNQKSYNLLKNYAKVCILTPSLQKSDRDLL